MVIARSIARVLLRVSSVFDCGIELRIILVFVCTVAISFFISVERIIM